jgi:hypothetical protein
MSSLDKVERPKDTQQAAQEAAGWNLSREAFSKEQLSQIPTPGGACIRDPQGYIDCGPIVGYPRPEAAPVEAPAKPGIPDSPVPWTQGPNGTREFPMIGNPFIQK